MPAVKDFLATHHIYDKVIAVGVSGGADSLALAIWAAENAECCNVKIVALTVDHQLRPESHAEAEYVAEIMQKYGVEHHILCWEGEKPSVGIEEAARIARYNLLKDWCFAHGIKSIMIAHHQLDQAETFFLRLHRGSGLDGLCGMRPVSDYCGLQILRPFLHTNPLELKKFLQTRNIAWVEDSSNQNEDFLRVKIRKFLPIFVQKTGIEIEKIIKAMDNLSKSKNYIDEQVEGFYNNHCRCIKDLVLSFSQSLFVEMPEEIMYRFLVFICKKISKKEYQPRAEEVQRLQKKMCSKNFAGATLNGCEIFCCHGKFWVVPENKDFVMPTKKEWSEFTKKNVEFLQRQFPGKVRRVLYSVYERSL